MATNSSLGAAKSAKKDEFYTQLSDIEKEIRHYRIHFKGKTVLCNCDDPYESNFFKYFALNFNLLGLKKLIATCYTGSPIAQKEFNLFGEPETPMVSRKAYKAIVTKVYDKTGDGAVDMQDVEALFRTRENEITELNGDGDFRSPECLALLDEADIVVTNPPFSLFREFVALLMSRQKLFLIIGNKNAVTYKDVFPYLMDNKVWTGVRSMNQDFWLFVPNGDSYEKLDELGRPIKHIMACWYTNLDIKKRHENMVLVKHYNPDEYPRYDNYDAIEVSTTSDIPCDYAGWMGVPITFLDKYCPEQFEIVGITKTWFGAASKTYGKQLQISPGKDPVVVSKLNDGPALRVDDPSKYKTCYLVDGSYFVQAYARILIRNKHPEQPRENS